MSLRRALLSGAALLGLSAGPVFAQAPAPSPEAAKAIEGQLRTWLDNTTGHAMKLPPRPIEFTAEGDHYAVRVPLAEIGKVDPADAALTATAKQLDATRWQVTNQKLPSAFTLTTTEKVPDAADAKNPSPTGNHNETVTYAFKIGDQTSDATIDTSYATPTTSTSTIKDFQSTKTGGAAPSTTTIASLNSTTTSTPIGPDRVDIKLDGTGNGYALKGTGTDGTDVSVAMDTLRVNGGLSGFAHAKAVPVVQLLVELGRISPANQDPGSPMTPEQKAVLRKVLVAAKDLLTGGVLAETAENVKFDVGGTTGTIGKVVVAFNGDAPKEMLTGGMEFTLNGLTLPDLPPQFSAYIPTHFTIKPTVSNLSVADLTNFGMIETAPPPGPGKVQLQPDVGALFKHGGIGFGLDALAFDIAGTEFTGTGKFTATSANAVDGTGQVTAKGLDGLIDKAQNDPLLAQGVPVLIFLKGIAKTDADKAVWNITAAKQTVLVNGVDLSKMAGAMK